MAESRDETFLACTARIPRVQKPAQWLKAESGARRSSKLRSQLSGLWLRHHPIDMRVWMQKPAQRLEAETRALAQRGTEASSAANS